MATMCECNISFGNTGKANCEPISDVTAKLIFVKTYADDGTRNAVLLTQAVDEAFLLERLNDADKSKRWYPSRPLVNVVDERADPVTETIEGVNYITDEGVRTFVGESVKTDTVYLGKISRGKCGAFSVFVVDKSGRLIGEISADGLSLNPLMIEQGTFSTKLVKTTSATVQRTQISFAYSTLIQDEDLRLRSSCADLVNAQGLLDVNAAVSGEAVTGFASVLTLDYGFAGAPRPVVGWVSADFEVYNVTQATSITPISVTENPDGTYTFVYTAAASADVIRLTQSATKTGFELYKLITTP